MNMRLPQLSGFITYQLFHLPCDIEGTKTFKDATVFENNVNLTNAGSTFDCKANVNFNNNTTTINTGNFSVSGDYTLNAFFTLPRENPQSLQHRLFLWQYRHNRNCACACFVKRNSGVYCARAGGFASFLPDVRRKADLRLWKRFNVVHGYDPRCCRARRRRAW